MSRKLVSKIQDIAGLPAKHKRVLLAWASFANNDGTNIFASKQSVAEKASIHRDTIYTNTEDLIAVGVLVPAESHVCKTKKCKQGNRHWTQQHGHYTVAYNIYIPLLENPTVLIEKLRGGTVGKSDMGTVGKHLKVTVVKSDATQAVSTTQAKIDSSVLTDGEVSKQVSKSEAATPLELPDIQAEKEKSPDAIYWESLPSDVKDLIDRVIPHIPDGGLEAEAAAATKLLQYYRLPEALHVLRYNRAHKTGGLFIRSCVQWKKAFDMGRLMSDYLTHNFDFCKVCRAHGIPSLRAFLEQEAGAASNKTFDVEEGATA